MNRDRIRGQLKQRIGRIKQQWGKFTANTLKEIEGRHDELTGKIQEAYGISRDEAVRQARDRGRGR